MVDDVGEYNKINNLSPILFCICTMTFTSDTESSGLIMFALAAYVANQCVKTIILEVMVIFAFTL